MIIRPPEDAMNEPSTMSGNKDGEKTPTYSTCTIHRGQTFNTRQQTHSVHQCMTQRQ